MNMKKMLFIVLALMPLALLASDNVETDIKQRVFNFVIFAGIVYYMLADKLKTFFQDRSKSIQSELDEVQNALEESKKKVEDANTNLEEAQKLATELVNEAQNDINSIKDRIAATYEQEINSLSKSFDDKLTLETRKAKSQIVNEVLNELLSDDNISISQDDLVNIVLKKVS